MSEANGGEGGGEGRDLDDFTVCIVGLGLMGGSLGLALRGKCRRVIGVARRPETAAEAVAIGAVDEAGTDPLALVPRADVIVLAAPVRTIIRQIGELATIMRPGAVLTDLGSTKAAICATMAAVRQDIQVIGGHPLCGRETSGLAAAAADLFRGRPYVLTPLPRTADATLSAMENLVRAVGADPVVMGAERHDRLVAAISHVPYALSACLAAAAKKAAETDAATWSLASTGFRDTARLAASDVQMMEDILLTNHANVAALARQSAAWLVDLAQELEIEDESSLRQRLSGAREAMTAYRRAQNLDNAQSAPRSTAGAGG